MSPAATPVLKGENGTPSASLAAVYGAAKALGRESLYLNLGYWADAPADYDAAAAALVDQVADAAGIGEGDVVLDAGFGFGDQDIRWAEQRKPDRIIGVNVIPNQIEAAKARVKAAGLEGRVELHQADATRLPVATGSVTRVVAVESALHFDSRADFFAEAYRVLDHGGRIALADIVPRPDRPLVAKVVDLLASRLWAIPAENLYDLGTYATRLEQAGFVDVEVRDLSQEVFVGFGKHVMEMLGDPEAVKRLGLETLLQWHQSTLAVLQFQYVLVSARKPGLPLAAAEAASPRRGGRRAKHASSGE